MTEFEIGFIGLIKSALTDEPANVPENFDWSRACALATAQRIEILLYYGITKSKIAVPEKIEKQLQLATCTAVMMNTRQLYELEVLYKAFESNEIYFAPLKGTVLKGVYKAPELRPMGDADILMKPEQYKIIEKLLFRLGYTQEAESDHDIVWNKDFLRLELKKSLVSPSVNKDFFKYYKNGWDFMKPASENSFRHDFSAEDHLIYIFTHFAGHYRNAGIGIKHLLDFYVYLKQKKDLDGEYIKNELQKLALWEFYSNILKTIAVWFENETGNEITDFITERMFSSSAFGSGENGLISDGLRRSKLSKIISIVFLPLVAMKNKYPILKKAPFLLPVMWVVRGFDTVFNKRESIKKQQAIMNKLSQENVSNYRKELQFVGLDFNFKE